MIVEGFIILPFSPPSPKPEPPARPDPPPYQGKLFCDAPPAKKSRIERSSYGLYYYEPIFTEKGRTGRFRVGKSEFAQRVSSSEKV